MQNMYRFMHLSSQTNLLLEPISGEECLLSRMMKPGTPARPGRPAQTRGPRRTGTHRDKGLFSDVYLRQRPWKWETVESGKLSLLGLEHQQRPVSASASAKNRINISVTQQKQAFTLTCFLLQSPRDIIPHHLKVEKFPSKQQNMSYYKEKIYFYLNFYILYLFSAGEYQQSFI